MGTYSNLTDEQILCLPDWSWNLWVIYKTISKQMSSVSLCFTSKLTAEVYVDFHATRPCYIRCSECSLQFSLRGNIHFRADSCPMTTVVFGNGTRISFESIGVCMEEEFTKVISDGFRPLVKDSIKKQDAWS